MDMDNISHREAGDDDEAALVDSFFLPGGILDPDDLLEPEEKGHSDVDLLLADDERLMSHNDDNGSHRNENSHSANRHTIPASSSIQRQDLRPPPLHFWETQDTWSHENRNCDNNLLLLGGNTPNNKNISDPILLDDSIGAHTEAKAGAHVENTYQNMSLQRQASNDEFQNHPVVIPSSFSYGSAFLLGMPKPDQKNTSTQDQEEQSSKNKTNLQERPAVHPFHTSSLAKTSLPPPPPPGLGPLHQQQQQQQALNQNPENQQRDEDVRQMVMALSSSLNNNNNNNNNNHNHHNNHADNLDIDDPPNMTMMIQSPPKIVRRSSTASHHPSAIPLELLSERRTSDYLSATSSLSSNSDSHSSSNNSGGGGVVKLLSDTNHAPARLPREHHFPAPPPGFEAAHLEQYRSEPDSTTQSNNDISFGIVRDNQQSEKLFDPPPPPPPPLLLQTVLTDEQYQDRSSVQHGKLETTHSMPPNTNRSVHVCQKAPQSESKNKEKDKQYQKTNLQHKKQHRNKQQRKTQPKDDATKQLLEPPPPLKNVGSSSDVDMANQKTIPKHQKQTQQSKDARLEKPRQPFQAKTKPTTKKSILDPVKNFNSDFDKGKPKKKYVASTQQSSTIPCDRPTAMVVKEKKRGKNSEATKMLSKPLTIAKDNTVSLDSTASQPDKHLATSTRNVDTTVATAPSTQISGSKSGKAFSTVTNSSELALADTNDENETAHVKNGSNNIAPETNGHHVILMHHNQHQHHDRYNGHTHVITSSKSANIFIQSDVIQFTQRFARFVVLITMCVATGAIKEATDQPDVSISYLLMHFSPIVGRLMMIYLVYVPHFFPGILLAAAVVWICQPNKNAKTSCNKRRTTGGLSEMITQSSVEHYSYEANCCRQMLLLAQWTLPLAVTVLSMVNDIPGSHTRLLAAYSLSILKTSNLFSPLAWTSGSMQVLLVVFATSCSTWYQKVGIEIVAAFLGLATLRFLRIDSGIPEPMANAAINSCSRQKMN